MPQVAFVTYRRLPGLSNDDRLAVAELAARGARVDAVVWDDPGVAWERYDAVVVRSCWDYHTRVAEFLAWVARLEAARVPLWNPPDVLRWNARKTYLRDLASAGVRVPPTHWAEPSDGAPLGDVLHERGWERAVVKPVVSASAHQTWVASAAEGAAGERRFREALASAGPLMVQPFVDALVREGEWSIVFLGGARSHAVVKRPAAGDFRVQAEHGGSAARAEPGAPIARQAEAALAAATRLAGVSLDRCLYARVDGYEDADGLVVMEMELLEPSLFLASDAAAPARFADAVLAAAGGSREQGRGCTASEA
ncbi:MAG: RimK family alpha-L-glutamate ligase [Gemmatimonadaceae bacterium]